MKKFFLGMDDELLVVKETSEGYTSTSHLTGTQPTRLAIDPQNNNRIYCATFGHGLWKSEDIGENWHKVGNENVDQDELSYVTSVAVHPIKNVNGNSIVYVGTEPSKLYFSENLGKTWTEFTGIHELPSKSEWSFPPRPETHYIRWITPSYLNEDHLGVSIEAGAFFSTDDHGKNWQDRPENSPIDIHTLLAHPKAPGRLYAANGDGVSKRGRSYAESEDEGRTWTYMSEGLENHRYAYNMVLNPDDPSDRLISAAKRASQAHRPHQYSAVYRKRGNQPWQENTEGLPQEGSSIHNLAANPTEIGTFYVMNSHGVFRMKDGDERWEKLDINWKDKYLDQRPSTFVVLEQ